jgi:hypothetical protein
MAVGRSIFAAHWPPAYGRKRRRLPRQPHSRSVTTHWRRRGGQAVRRWKEGLGRRVDLFTVVGLGAVLVLAGLLHLWQLNRTGLRGDEAVYSGQAAVLAGAEGYQRHFLLVSRGNSNFLLFQELLSLIYRLFGVGDLAGRLMSAVLSIATVLVVFLTGRLLYGRWAALLAALLLGLSSYALSLGRLALLDPLVALLSSVAVLCLVLWDRNRRTAWLVAFAAMVSLALQAKVVGVLLGGVFVGYLLVTRSWRALTIRALLASAAMFVLCLTPALFQVLHTSDQLINFLHSSVHRRSQVDWYYYGRVLHTYEGLMLPLVWAAGIVLALVRRTRSDVLLLLVVGIGAAFFQLYPLKAFNYVLILVPSFCILAGRALAELRVPRIAGWPSRVLAPVAALVLGVLAMPHLNAVLHDNTAAGLREASNWLSEHGARQAGVMTLSHGSAQYVFSFYGHHDAYPYGRFQLATVLPGGEAFKPKPDPLGGTPRDWVTSQPERLLNNGSITYLVYYNNKLAGLTPQSEDGAGDEPLVHTSTQRRFQQLISAYGGRLVHTVREGNDPTVWVYEVWRQRPRPVGSYTVRGEVVHLTAAGFQRNSALRVVYKGRQLTTARSDDGGSLDTSLRLPAGTDIRYRLIVTDETGNYLSLIGLPRPQASVTVRDGKVVVRAADFTPEAHITATYHGTRVATAVADRHGAVLISFRLADGTRPRYRLVIADAVGNRVTLIKLPASLTNRSRA